MYTGPAGSSSFGRISSSTAGAIVRATGRQMGVKYGRHKVSSPINASSTHAVYQSQMARGYLTFVSDKTQTTGGAYAEKVPLSARISKTSPESMQKRNSINKIYNVNSKIPSSGVKQAELLAEDQDYIPSGLDDAVLSQEELLNYTHMLTGKFLQAELSPADRRRDQSWVNSQKDIVEAREYVKEAFDKPFPIVKDFHEDTEILFATKDLDQVYQNSQEFIDRTQRFKHSLEDILKTATTKEAKIETLERFLYEGNIVVRDDTAFAGIERFDSQELKAVYMKLWDLGAYDQMVEMMENSINPYFTNNPINLEFYARANLKGHHFSPPMALAVAELLLEKTYQAEGKAILGTLNAIAKNAAKNVLQDIDEGKPISNSKIDFYNKCFPNSSLEREAVLENYQAALQSSASLYQEAFLDSFDCRYGSRTMHRVIEQGGSAQEIAELTKLSALKEGGLKSNNLSVVSNYLEALYVLKDSDPKEIKLAENAVLSLAKSESLTYTLMGSLEDLAVDSESKNNFLGTLGSHLKSLRQDPQNTQIIVEQRRQELRKSFNAWEQFTFNYRGVTSNYIEGNFKFGAQLPAHNINRYDRKFFGEVLQTSLASLLGNAEKAEHLAKDLQSISNFEEFNQTVDTLIRTRFHTDEWNLERLDSEGHKVFDESAMALIALSGGRTQDMRKMLPSSRTNIATNFALGIGDCRHQTQVKQMLFDLWQSHHLNSILADIEEARSKHDLEKVEGLRNQFIEINSHELRTLDCIVYLPTAIENEFPVWHEGHLVKNEKGSLVKVEEHTLNVGLEYNKESGDLEGITFRDAFYQHTYPWGNCKIDAQGKHLLEGIKAGKTEIYDRKTGNLESVDIIIKPTSYSGSREVYDRGSNENCFIGQPIKQLSVSEALKQPVAESLEKAREWYRQQQEKITSLAVIEPKEEG